MESTFTWREKKTVISLSCKENRWLFFYESVTLPTNALLPSEAEIATCFKTTPAY